MKFGKYNITAKNIFSFIQGNARKLIDRFGGDFIKLEDHIKEQIVFRDLNANPECKDKQECIHCGCPIPDLFYADKGCDLGCYPNMMSKEDWDKFKEEQKEKDETDKQ